MSSDEPRAALLVDLIERRRAPHEVTRELAAFGWDSERTLCEVKAVHVRREIGGFLNGELAASDVESWADAVEVRDDLSFESPAVREAVHVLANPVLEGPLRERAAELFPSLHPE